MASLLSLSYKMFYSSRHWPPLGISWIPHRLKSERQSPSYAFHIVPLNRTDKADGFRQTLFASAFGRSAEAPDTYPGSGEPVHLN
jgi:hypothetical protein